MRESGGRSVLKGVTNGMWTPVVAAGCYLCWSNWLCVFEVALLIAVVMVE